MKKGFTLAEVLITLGVIGVVAALTLPNLLQNHQKKVFVTQLQRTVNLISNSATALMGDNNAASLADSYLVAVASKKRATKEGKKKKEEITYDTKNAQGKFMNTYFKVARDCGEDNISACVGETYYSLDRSQSFNLSESVKKLVGWGNTYCVTINTGATICMSPMREDYQSGSYFEHGWAEVVVDVNGPSGPNTNGRDLFQFQLYSDGKIGNCYNSTDDYCKYQAAERCQDFKSSAGYGGSCFQHIMSNGWVMDY